MRELYPWPAGVLRHETPAIVLLDPKFPHNVGQAVRMAAAFGALQVIYTGERMENLLEEMGRLPREERLRAYRNVGLERDQAPLDRFIECTPVCVEVSPQSESLPDFIHPPDAVYVFGPEDGHVPQSIRALCHRFVRIPSVHCLNLASAVGVVLYDRIAKAGVR